MVAAVGCHSWLMAITGHTHRRSCTSRFLGRRVGGGMPSLWHPRLQMLDLTVSSIPKPSLLLDQTICQAPPEDDVDSVDSRPTAGPAPARPTSQVHKAEGMKGSVIHITQFLPLLLYHQRLCQEKHRQGVPDTGHPSNYVLSLGKEGHR